VGFDLSTRAGEFSPATPAPTPFTDQRFKDAILAAMRRNLAPMLSRDPFASQADVGELHYAPEIEPSTLKGMTFGTKGKAARQAFRRRQAISAGDIKPENYEEEMFGRLFKRRPDLVRGVLEQEQQFAIFDERKGSVSLGELAELDPGPFDRAVEWVLGDNAASNEDREALAEAVWKRYRPLKTQVHELRHLAMRQPKYWEYIRRFDLNREDLNRAMDWYYAPRHMRSRVLRQSMKGGETHQRRFDFETEEEFAAWFSRNFVHHIKAMERL